MNDSHDSQDFLMSLLWDAANCADWLVREIDNPSLQTQVKHWEVFSILKIRLEKIGFQYEGFNFEG